MRKIEKDMVQAIRSGENRRLSNTTILHDGDTCAVRLHGHLIATITNQEMRLSHCGWMTPTTKSRLNAILEGLNINDRIYQKAGVWYTKDGLFDINFVWAF